MVSKIIKKITSHKIISGIILAAILVGGYFLYQNLTKNSGSTQYATAAVEKGTLIISVSGSGQVSALDQVDIKPKISGDVVYVGVKNGQDVKKGALLVQFDTKDAQKSLRDAQISLDNAQITLNKLRSSQGIDISKLQDLINTAQNNLSQAYQNGFNEVVNSFLDLPDILEGTRGILYDTNVGQPDQKINIAAYQDLTNDSTNSAIVISMTNRTVSEYADAVTKYDKNLNDYRNASRFSTSDEIIFLINETLETGKTMAQLVKDEQNLLDTVVSTLQYKALRTVPTVLLQYQTDISGYIGKLNSHISSLNNTKNSITSNQQSLTSYLRDLETTQENNPYDITSQENTVEQRQATLQDAQDALAKYYVRAPFDGVIVDISAKTGDSLSGGTSVVTLITKQRIAEVSLNEVDAAKVKAGQKVTLTFDAIEDLTISGEVSEIDALGIVIQGVVSYNTKIGFDTQDDRVKPGMTVSASIIVDAKQNVLLVPSSAVKMNSGISYVQLIANASNTTSTANVSGLTSLQSLTSQTIDVGASNDTMTEILSGVSEGDIVVTQTINSSTTTSTTQQNNGFRVPGGGASGGAFFRD